MKWFRLFGVISIFAVTAMACQIFGKSVPTAATEAPGPGGEEYPVAYPEIPYPDPTALAALQSPQEGIPYPDLKDGDTIEWYSTTELILGGLVTKVVQSHDLTVYVTLKDGRTFKTFEPAIDDVIKVIEACGDKCKDIEVATE